MNLIILGSDEVNAEGLVRLHGPRAAHLLKVIKVAPGQAVRVGVLNGARGLATVHSTSEGTVDLRCALDAFAPPRPRVDLLLAVPRPKVMRRLWAQLSALGVYRIILTNAERVERPYFDTHMLEPECYNPLLIEGLQQARDTLLPIVSIHRRFRILIEDVLDGITGPTLRLAADPEAVTPLSEVVSSGLRANPGERVLLAIGPEGGWNSFELGLLDAHGFHRVSMGPRVLRSDTACVALLAIVHAALPSSPW